MSVTGSLLMWSSDALLQGESWMKICDCLGDATLCQVSISDVSPDFPTLKTTQEFEKWHEYEALEAPRKIVYSRWGDAGERGELKGVHEWFDEAKNVAVMFGPCGWVAEFIAEWATLGTSVTGDSEMSHLSATIGPHLVVIGHAALTDEPDEWHRCNFSLSFFGYGTPPSSEVAREAIMRLRCVTKLRQDLERVLGPIGIGIYWSA